MSHSIPYWIDALDDAKDAAIRRGAGVPGARGCSRRRGADAHGL
jgi:hypothetical protein